MRKMFFATDGSYGDGKGLVILDVTNEEDRYSEVFDQLSERERYAVALGIWEGKGSIDQQDCPAMHSHGMDDTLTDCGFTGYVYRNFLDPTRGEDGGYEWTCPQCGTLHEWEGVELDEGASAEVTGIVNDADFPATLAVPHGLLSAVLITREQNQLTAQFAEVTKAVPATRGELAELLRTLAAALEQQERDLQTGSERP